MEERKMASHELRASLMGGLWMVSAFVLAAVFLSAGLQDGLTSVHIAFAAIFLVLAVAGSFFVWNMRVPGDEENREKAKRERIDNMLRDMSDDELLELKQRLSTGDMSDETILDYLSDDGELVMRE